MKKIKLFTLAAAAVLALASCDNSVIAPQQNEGALQINFNVPEATRAAAQGNEAVISNVQVLIFDASDNLYKYYAFTSAEVTAKTATVSNVIAGTYKVYVVANGPDMSDLTTLATFKAEQIELSEYNSASSDFVMEGHDDAIAVSGGGIANANIAISRYVARVVLKKVTNSLPEAYGNLTIERAFLSNVVRVQNIGGNFTPASAGDWCNKEGRQDDETRVASHIIDGTTYTATAAGLTYADIDQAVANGGNYSSVKYFYGYPNVATAEPNGFVDPFAAQRSVLVIVGTFNSKTYYYPVVLNNGLARNTSYEVEATITGAGSDDPNKPVQSGSISVTITVENWLDGTSYTETF